MIRWLRKFKAERFARADAAWLKSEATPGDVKDIAAVLFKLIAGGMAKDDANRLAVALAHDAVCGPSPRRENARIVIAGAREDFAAAFSDAGGDDEEEDEDSDEEGPA